ncbi:hypothetical protein DFQ29_004236, partial [Apophysomyces sp. BC1021]
MRLRIRHANGIATLDNLLPEHTVIHLRKNIAATLNQPFHQCIQVSAGYPPRPLENDEAALRDVSLRDGDALHVTVIEYVPPPTLNNIENTYAVETEGGFLTLRTMDDDNSCLFRSI